MRRIQQRRVTNKTKVVAVAQVAPVEFATNRRPKMIRALIFDFNGVIADDETPHLTCFRQALLEAGLILTVDDYYGQYLGMDERTCAALLLTARDGAPDAALLRNIA